MPIRSADYDPLMDELPPELAAEYKAEKRRQKMAELMSGQAMQPLQAPEVKGRFQGAISPLQGIAQLAQAYMAGKQLEGSDARMADIGARNQGLQAEAVAQYKRSTAGTPEMPMGPPTEEGAMGVQPAVTPDPQQRQQAIVDAITGANPRLAKLGQMDFQGDLATQTRKDAAQARIDQINQAERERRITKEEADVRRAEEAVKQDKRDKETKEYMLRVAASMRPAREAPAPTVLTDNAGNVTLLDRGGNVIKKLEGAGKPSAGFEKAGAAKKKLGTDLDTVIAELENATKDGGLIDKSTGSGVGSLVDMGAAAFGIATPGAIAAGRMGPIFDMVLKMVPRFEGPQSDKDTQSYKEAAGNLANPATPNETKKMAGREILRLMKKRKGQFIDKAIEGTEADIPAGGGGTSGAVRVVDW